MTQEGTASGTSLLSLILDASPEVMAVLLLCGVASIVSWFIIGAKWWEFRGYAARGREFARATARALTVEAREQAVVHLLPSPHTSLLRTAAGFMNDLRAAMQAGNVQRSGLSLTQLEALTMTLDADVRGAVERAGRRLPWLATIGSTAPLLGLLGTVLGIIGAFAAIGQSGQSSLQSVGPFIAEALVATAAGLVAAIPAVMAYNIFTARREHLEGELERIAQELIGSLGREGKL